MKPLFYIIVFYNFMYQDWTYYKITTKNKETSQLFIVSYSNNKLINFKVN
jgi:hypothetical protein